ncbi:uncharacterized protein V6R79_025974 [Siganus canaliculatus]
MTAALDPFRPSSTELHVIRRLNTSLHRTEAAIQRPEPGSTRTHVARAPLRDEVSLLDPCCGQLSAGARVDLGVKGQRKFIYFPHVASALWVPPDFRGRVSDMSSMYANLRQEQTWNSRKIPDAAWRARIGGKVQPLLTKISHSLRGRQRRELLTAVSLTNTAADVRSYEEVCWDAKLPRRLKASDTTLEKMADPVTQRPSWRRYGGRPQRWQSVGAEWNRQQLRSRNDARKPISFCSGCPRSGQIPLYSGTVGSENMDNIDNVEMDFHPLTLKRSVVPSYTLTARRTTIPGYTGRAASALSAVPAVCSAAHCGEPKSPTFGHTAPLSRMVTSATPFNPFLRPALPASHSTARRDLRQSR